MEIRRGTPVSPGIVIGQAFVIETEGVRIPRKFIMPEEVQEETERFRKALESAKAQVLELERKVESEIDSKSKLADIFRSHYAMLEDKAWTHQVANLIKNKNFTAEYATSEVLRRYINTIERLGDRYFSQRTADIYDIQRRIVENLLGEGAEDLARVGEPVVVVAKNLSPSQTVSLDRSKILGFVTDQGGRTSHTAILSKALEIPAIVGIPGFSKEISTGDTIIVDGIRGVVVIDPDEVTTSRYRTMEHDVHVFEEKVTEEVRGLPCVTTDGREITMMANIEFPTEVTQAIELGAAGIGLYRTEFLYKYIDHPPDEEEQFNAYVQAMDQLNGRPITIRLLDLGADKMGGIQDEKNPFLGCRSIRLLLKNSELFRTQLRALFRASVYGELRIMLPLVSTVSELVEAKQIIDVVKNELDSDRVEFNADVPLGCMIEVPSAALTADHLAKECDFFSIGTNDLIQYTLAVDRGNSSVADLYTPGHPAVLQLIDKTVKSANNHDIPVAVCGEMAGDPIYAILLIGLGVINLSIGPKAIPEIKKFLRSVSYKEAAVIAEKALKAGNPEDTVRLLEDRVREILPEIV